MLISVKEWKVGVTIIEKEPGKVAVSFRSKDDIDVAAIAQKIGGGGHRLAAGAWLLMSFEEAKNKVIDALGKGW